MNDHSTLKAQILSIIEKYAFDKQRVRNAQDNARIILDLKINSARMVDIILDLEDMYQITIDDENLANLSTVKDVISFISNAIGQQ